MATFTASAIIKPAPLRAAAQFFTTFNAIVVKRDYGLAYQDGYNAGKLVAPIVDVSTNVAFFAFTRSGLPLTGLTPTWLNYYNAESGAPQSQPSFSEVGDGSYKFTPTGTSPAGMIDLGAPASQAIPRYLVYNSVSPVVVFGAFDEWGEPLPALTPTWVALRKASDNSDFLPQPAITQLGNGLYKTSRLSEHCIGTIDLGPTAFPRYYQYDSEITASSGGGGGGEVPIITNLTLPPIVRETIIVMNITTPTVPLIRVFVYAQYTKPNSWEVIFDGENWGPAFTPTGTANTKTNIAGGFQFRMLRTGGWQQTPSIRMIGISGGQGP